MGLYIVFVCMLNAFMYLHSYDNLSLFRRLFLFLSVFFSLTYNLNEDSLHLVWNKRLNLLQDFSNKLSLFHLTFSNTNPKQSVLAEAFHTMPL